MDNCGLILRVDLTTGKISREPISPELRRKYLGGEGINDHLLWEHFLKVDINIDPLSPDNVLIAGIGPLGATGWGAGSKITYTFKSPLTNIYGDTTSGGGLGAQLRWAGYDHIVVTGQAKRPVYLWIDDDVVTIRDASQVWGKDTHETEEMIKEELGDPGVEIACIGQAGENLVRVANIISRSHRAAGRMGGGCVFGSKNLKAIVARGTKGLNIHDRDAFFKAMDDLLPEGYKDPAVEQRMRYGSLQITRSTHELGGNQYRNAQGWALPEEAVDKLDHNWYTNNIGVRAWACSPGCAFACSGWGRIKGDESPAAKRYAGEWSTKPEYGASNPFGASCDVPDMPAVMHINAMCNRYGMDVMEIGMTLSFLMELWERGIITRADTAEWTGGDLSLEWGNYQAMEQIIEAIALQKNKLGNILRGGVYQAAKQIGELKGVDVLKYALYGKGHATHEGNARPWPRMGMACAMSSIGAHHTHGSGVSPEISMYFFGNPDAGDILSTTLRGAAHAVSESMWAVNNSLGICFTLVRMIREKTPLETIARALWAATGIKLTPEELWQAGERIANIQKAFNSRLGLRREDDFLCHRWMNEPRLEGLVKGYKGANYIEKAKDEYYQWRGWDRETSLQTMKKLKELDLLDVARVLKKENAVVS